MSHVNHTLSKQKRRLAVLFSLSIFGLIILLGIGFISFKYFDYQRQEMERLTLQWDNISKVFSENPNLGQSVLEGRGFIFPTIRRGPGEARSPRNDGRVLRPDNFFLYGTENNNILFSPIKDDELYASILKEVQSRESRTFELNGKEYFFTQKDLVNGISWIFFSESRLTDETILMDFFTYLVFAAIISLIIYLISSRFIDTTLSPVEENLEQMEQFIHNAGHELKTPLAVVKSSLELMRLKKNYEEGISESIGELNRMNTLIHALIQFSTLHTFPERNKIDLTETVEKIVKTYTEMAEKKDIAIRIVDNGPSPVFAHREYLEICLSNLISNSIKYNKRGGSITINLNPKNIEIVDSGIGISPENIGKIFDRFYREGERDEQSFGIGLSLVKKIADMYRWKILVRSEKNTGTTVTVRW